MKNGSIWAIGNLEEVEQKMEGLYHLVSSLGEVAEHTVVSARAIFSVCDLIDAIRGDLKADIDYLERCAEGGATA